MVNGKTGEMLRYVFVLILSAVVGYFTAIGAIQTRVAVVETKVERFGQDIQEIKNDVKTLLRR